MAAPCCYNRASGPNERSQDLNEHQCAAEYGQLEHDPQSESHKTTGPILLDVPSSPDPPQINETSES